MAIFNFHFASACLILLGTLCLARATTPYLGNLDTLVTATRLLYGTLSQVQSLEELIPEECSCNETGGGNGGHIY